MNVRALTLSLACGFTAAQAPLPTNLPRGWERRGDALVGAPHAAPLDSGFTLANESARVEVELQLADGRATAASLVIGGSHVGFCGRDGRPFVEGPLFGGETRSLDARGDPGLSPEALRELLQWYGWGELLPVQGLS